MKLWLVSRETDYESREIFFTEEEANKNATLGVVNSNISVFVTQKDLDDANSTIADLQRANSELAAVTTEYRRKYDEIRAKLGEAESNLMDCSNENIALRDQRNTAEKHCLEQAKLHEQELAKLRAAVPEDVSESLGQLIEFAEARGRSPDMFSEDELEDKCHEFLATIGALITRMQEERRKETIKAWRAGVIVGVYGDCSGVDAKDYADRTLNEKE